MLDKCDLLNSLTVYYKQYIFCDNRNVSISVDFWTPLNNIIFIMTSLRELTKSISTPKENVFYIARNHQKHNLSKAHSSETPYQ